MLGKKDEEGGISLSESEIAAVNPSPMMVTPQVAISAVPTQLEAAAADSTIKNVTVLGKSFSLMSKLSLGASVDLDKAQREEDIGGIVHAASRLIVQEQREDFLKVMLENDNIDLDMFLDVMSDAMASVAGRPTPSAGS